MVGGGEGWTWVWRAVYVADDCDTEVAVLACTGQVGLAGGGRKELGLGVGVVICGREG